MARPCFAEAAQLLLLWARLGSGAHCTQLRNLSFLGRPQGCYPPQDQMLDLKHSLLNRKVRLPGLDPLLATHEFRLWDCYLSSASTYFEFGLGGSTVQALRRHSQLNVHSVELSAEWVALMRQEPGMAKHISDGRLVLEHVDVGPLGDWTYPKWNNTRCGSRWRRRRGTAVTKPGHNQEGRNGGGRSRRSVRVPGRNDTVCSRSSWPRVSDALQRAQEQIAWDVVFIDGRFRVASFLKSLMAIVSSSAPGAVLIMHDYSPLRAYKVVERFAEMEACAGSLAAFRPKDQIDKKELMQVIAAFEYIAD